MGCGKPYLGESTLAQVCCLRFINCKLGDSYFLAGLVATKKFSSHMVLSQLEMAQKLGFERKNC
jgi:hypothetical protein